MDKTILSAIYSQMIQNGESVNLRFKLTQSRNKWFAPACEQSKALLRLFNRKALKQKEIDMLIEIGFNIERVE